MDTLTATWEPETGWSIDLLAVPTTPGASFVLAFVDPDLAAGPVLAQIREALPGTPLLACSTAGQILGPRVDPAPVVLMVATFARSTVHSACVFREGHTDRELGHHLGSLLAASGSPVAGILLLCGGLAINGSDVLAGLGSALPEGTPVFGGLAADGPRFGRTWIDYDGQHAQDGLAAIAILGDSVELRHGSEGGWDGFGPMRTITRSAGNVLYELDGQPALALYKQYLGERARDLPGSALFFPLTVSSPDGTTTVMRTVLGVDETDQSLTFAGDLPQGWNARLMWTTTEALMDGASESGEAGAQSDADMALVVSCVGRRMVLGDRTEEELECVHEALGGRTPMIGFYSYGEITPASGASTLHNQTMTVTTLRERR